MDAALQIWMESGFLERIQNLLNSPHLKIREDGTCAAHADIPYFPESFANGCLKIITMSGDPLTVYTRHRREICIDMMLDGDRLMRHLDRQKLATAHRRVIGLIKIHFPCIVEVEFHELPCAPRAGR